MAEIETILTELCKKDLDTCTYEEIYTALLHFVEAESAKRVTPVSGRKLYYISAESENY